MNVNKFNDNQFLKVLNIIYYWRSIMINNHFPLLTVHLFISKKNTGDGLEEMLKRFEESEITVKQYKPGDTLPEINPKKPNIFVSLGSEWLEFTELVNLPFYEKKRWLHFDSSVSVEPSHVFHCWLNYSNPLTKIKTIPTTQFSSETPLVSIFTASYKSKDKILRPYHSLLNQTYTNWEWVIVDDSDDGEITYKESLLPLNDSRVRRYRQDSRNGYIGATKRYAAGLCTGEILVELDHDDELTQDCLEKIVRVFQQNPDCGFVFGDCTEVYVGNNDAHWYGWDCGFGFCMYYRVWVHKMNRWQNVLKHTVINSHTISHLVGLPNHPRAWTRDCYHLIGGHREELLVADDYDILIRTFLCTKYVAIPDLLYIQYRNENGDNSTFQRNKQIQLLVKELNSFYYPQINMRIQELGLPIDISTYSRVWDRTIDDPALKSAHIIHENLTKVSILISYSIL